MKSLIAAGVLYALGFIFTFGHAFNQYHETEDGLITSSGEASAATGFICGLFWPLYWSAEGLKFVRPTQNKAP